jgi:glutathione peroxidase-family protein
VGWCHAAAYKEYNAKGFEVLAFPCNQFWEQEPEGPKEIRAFADSFGATFPMFAKVDVNGPKAIPLYRWLKTMAGGGFFYGPALKCVPMVINRARLFLSCPVLLSLTDDDGGCCVDPGAAHDHLDDRWNYTSAFCRHQATITLTATHRPRPPPPAPIWHFWRIHEGVRSRWLAEFLIGKDGKVIRRYGPTYFPNKIMKDVEKELAQ